MLTVLAIEKLKPKEKPYKVSDGNRLSLSSSRAGGKLWRLRFKFGGKEKMLSLGSFPEVSLADARAKRDEALAQLANGIDPSEQKKQDKLVAEVAGRNTFGAIAEEYLQRLKESGLTEITPKQEPLAAPRSRFAACASGRSRRSRHSKSLSYCKSTKRRGGGKPRGDYGA